MVSVVNWEGFTVWSATPALSPICGKDKDLNGLQGILDKHLKTKLKIGYVKSDSSES